MKKPRIQSMSQSGLGLLWFKRVGLGLLIGNRLVMLWRIKPKPPSQ